jgi:tetratricopeptide repeat protein
MAHVVEISPVRQAWRDAQRRVAQGDLDGARELLEEQIAQATISDDPDVLDTRRRLAEVHYGLGRPADARRELEEALAAGAAHLGDAHPLMLALRARLGAVAAEIGNRFEARRNFSIVAEHGPRVLGSTHTAVRVAESYLAANAPKVQAPTASPATSARQSGGASRPAPPAARPPTTAAPPPGPAVRPAASPPAATPPAVVRPGGGPPAGRGDRSADPARPPAASGGAAPPRAMTLEDEHWLDEPPRETADDRAGPRWASRLSNRFLIGTAVLLLLVVGAVAVVLRVAARERVPPAPAPSPPTGVTVKLSGGTATVSWLDPARGTVPFIVSGGVSGQTSRIRQPVPAGQTSLTLNGLDAKRDYCFTVVAVYGADSVAVSGLTCGHRK